MCPMKLRDIRERALAYDEDVDGDFENHRLILSFDEEVNLLEVRHVVLAILIDR